MPESLSAPPSAEERGRPRPAGRRASAVLGVAAVALLAAGAAGCSSGGKAAPAATGSAAATGHASQPASNKATGSLSTPDQIASLQKAADQTVAKKLLKQIKVAAGNAKLAAVSYEDSAHKSRTVLIYGGVGIPVPPGNPGAQLKSMLKSGTQTGVKVGQAATVDAGSAGGMAQCAPVPSSGGSKFVNCGWINGKDALVMSFDGFSKHKAQALVPQIIAAMVSD
jgi:hypothetical protein